MRQSRRKEIEVFTRVQVFIDADAVPQEPGYTARFTTARLCAENENVTFLKR